MSTEPEPAPAPFVFSSPRPARAGLARRVDLPEYLPARMLNEFVYCPRLFFYEWVEGVFAESGDTVEGTLWHEKIRGRAEALRPANPQSTTDTTVAERVHARSITLSSDRLRLIAVIDLVEGEGRIVTPIDYKRGAPRDGANGPEAWPADRAQVCVQALILRDNGYACDEAVVYYGATRQRVGVAIDESLASETVAHVEYARRLAESGRIPRPLVDSPKCPRCSLVSICLPDETTAAMGMTETEENQEQQLALFSGEPERERRPLIDRADEPVRRLVPARDDLRPLYVTGYGLSIGKKDEVLQVRDRDGVVQEARLHDISQVNVFGGVAVTSAAVLALCGSQKPIAYFSAGHWFSGMTTGMGLRNVFLRRDQFARAEDPAFCLAAARDIVTTKIRNQRTFLQRNHIEPPARALAQLKALAEKSQQAAGLDVLLGIEGSAARVYFGEFHGMLKVDDDAEAREGRAGAVGGTGISAADQPRFH
jgi:CRISP-associated protein Cas1